MSAPNMVKWGRACNINFQKMFLLWKGLNCIQFPIFYLACPIVKMYTNYRSIWQTVQSFPSLGFACCYPLLFNNLECLNTDWNGCYIRFFLRCIFYADLIVSNCAPAFKQTQPDPLSVDADFAFARCSLIIWNGWIQVELNVILGGLGTSRVVFPLSHILHTFACCAPHTVLSSGGPFFQGICFDLKSLNGDLDGCNTRWFWDKQRGVSSVACFMQMFWR